MAKYSGRLNTSESKKQDLLLLEPNPKNLRRMVGRLRRVNRDAIFHHEWPRPEYDRPLSDPLFLFILTPPYSGSTALAQVLNTSPGAVFLQERGEGQWLVPGMCQRDRWMPEKYIDWESVKSVWWSRLSLIEKLTGPINVVIEKSPANLVRAEALLQNFPRHQVIALNRNPYANCSSVMYRHFFPEKMTPKERKWLLERLAFFWVYRSQWLKKQIEQTQALAFSYEQFCEQPAEWVSKIADRVPEFQQIDASHEIKVKDYPIQKISNQNGRQIEKLLDSDKEIIAEFLRPHEDLLNYYGYRCDWESALDHDEPV
ncbi:MAG: sulfotransferase [Pontiellaceae bacterium]|nr:sulfotransferase [Pontiellaceae bacterium]MBN2783922.1 sulfotransferase [Pontiellaceae bacterium]